MFSSIPGFSNNPGHQYMHNEKYFTKPNPSVV